MTRQPLQTFDHLDWESLTCDTLELQPDQIEHAIQLSRVNGDAPGEWQIYRNALALLGFEQWLAERAPDLALKTDTCSLHQPAHATWIDAVCAIQVGEFRVCLKAIGGVTDTTIELPRAAIELPDWAAHFYGVVEVLEEQEQVRVAGFIRRDRLLPHLPSANEDWTYTAALEWFDTDTDQLLLQLRCLEPRAVPLFTPALSVTASQLQTRLMAVLPHLQQGGSLWQWLAWEDAATLLTTPTLAAWLHSALRSTTADPAVPIPSAILLEATRPNPSPGQAMNVGLWLRDQLDAVATELSWVLLPAFTLAGSPLRSVMEAFQTATAELERNGMAIAPEARAAYRDIRWGTVALRLYATTWALPRNSLDQSPEWSLLLMLGAQPSTILPAGVQLRVEDPMHVLVDRVLTQESADAYLYARVVGDWHEQFWATITLPNGIIITLPPFAFSPNSQP